mmetsp:Transcript_19794/g.27215  ORF Transcript_19794/g.27215 Transcript_19794/m.27215 type:complete len:201 (-) Transcript_19794:1290-1892(-)
MPVAANQRGDGEVGNRQRRGVRLANLDARYVLIDAYFEPAESVCHFQLQLVGVDVRHVAEALCQRVIVKCHSPLEAVLRRSHFLSEATLRLEAPEAGPVVRHADDDIGSPEAVECYPAYLLVLVHSRPFQHTLRQLQTGALQLREHFSEPHDAVVSVLLQQRYVDLHVIAQRVEELSLLLCQFLHQIHRIALVAVLSLAG